MAELDPNEEKYFLHSETFSEDQDEGYKYEEVSIDEETISSRSEDFKTLLEFVHVDDIGESSGTRTVEEQEATSDSPVSVVKEIPESVEDFICNFLAQLKMRKTLNAFQVEWYEMEQNGLLSSSPYLLPDIYTSIAQLETQIKQLEKDLAVFKKISFKARGAYIKLQKQRDFHRMNHHRVVLEKDQLLKDIVRVCQILDMRTCVEANKTMSRKSRIANNKLKKHYKNFEPALKEFRGKYESAMKHKMLTKIELERTETHCEELIHTIKNLDIKPKLDKKIFSESIPTAHQCGKDEKVLGPTQKKLADERDKRKPHDAELPKVVESKFPVDPKINPVLQSVQDIPAYPIRSGGFKLNKTFHGHKQPISSVCLHSKNKILATASDDKTWKLWAMPTGELITTGEGHTDWIADCAFDEAGVHLATCGGDKTVKIWDFSTYKCQHTFKDHQLCVWSCSWHWTGNFVASSSRDNTIKVWDLQSLRCRSTLRGHTDSVNSIRFVYFSNILLSSSTDKTVSLWDARTGLCGQTFYGHASGVNFAAINQKGDEIASCDSQGIMKIWDTRAISSLVTFEAGNFSANKLAFDYTSSVIAVACDDHTVKIFDTTSGQLASLMGHEDAVQCVDFEASGQYLISGGSDGTVRFWS